MKWPMVGSGSASRHYRYQWLGVDHLIFVGGGVRNWKKKACTRKFHEKKSMHQKISGKKKHAPENLRKKKHAQGLL